MISRLAGEANNVRERRTVGQGRDRHCKNLIRPIVGIRRGGLRHFSKCRVFGVKTNISGFLSEVMCAVLLNCPGVLQSRPAPIPVPPLPLFPPVQTSLVAIGLVGFNPWFE